MKFVTLSAAKFKLSCQKRILLFIKTWMLLVLDIISISYRNVQDEEMTDILEHFYCEVRKKKDWCYCQACYKSHGVTMEFGAFKRLLLEFKFPNKVSHLIKPEIS